MYLRVSVLLIALIGGTLLPTHQAVVLATALLAGGLAVAVRLRSAGLLRMTALTAVFLLYASYFVTSQLSHRLPLSAQPQEVELTGCISGLPQRIRSPMTGREYLKTDFLVDSNQLSPAGLRRLRLNWYNSAHALHPGDCFSLSAVLRSPRNLANGLPFDYEAYLLFQGIDASGYVRSAQPLSEQRPPGLRDRLLAQTASTMPEPASVWIRGLLFGDGSAFAPEQWQWVRNTGTLHLLVVSGLHVGLMALAGFWAGRVLQRPLVMLSRGRLAQAASLLPALSGALAASGYLLLAGTGLPLLRAWLMAVAGVLLLSSARRFRPTLLLLLAAPGVLLFNPLAWTQAGFWYSFTAVLALIAVFRGRRSGFVMPWLLPQLVVFLMLLPVMMFWGQPVSVVHILANVIAVPLLSFVLLPLAVLCLLFPHPWLISALSASDHTFWWMLQQFVSWQVPVFHPPGLWVMAGWCGLVLLFLAGAHLRLVLPLSLLILVLLLKPLQQESGVWLFDSGQGQSLLVSDGSGAVLIDTGARFSPSFSIAEAVILPWLQRSGITELELLILSHSDHDHAGGADLILNQIPVRRFLAGQPQHHPGSEPCHGLDTVQVSPNLLLRFYSIAPDQRSSDNDASCVVQIQWPGPTVLVPGDLTAEAERLLVLRYGAELQSDVLIAGHHGSKTSTSAAFLRAVEPGDVWISAGFGNRFGHPHPLVLERLQQAGLAPRVTADTGLIRLWPDGQVRTGHSGWQPRWRQPG